MSGPVALVGFGESMDYFRELPDSVPIWTVNASQIDTYNFPHIDRMFDMHKLQDLILDKPRVDRLLEELPYPIYMLDEFPPFPSVKKYPLNEYLAEVFELIYLGDKHAKFADSSFPYMLAMAVWEGYSPIHIYGFEFRADTEYRYQRIGAGLLIGWAAGKGAEIRLPETSSLLPDTLYGYTDYQTISRQTLETELAKFQNRLQVWLGNFNLAEAKAKEREDNGASEAEYHEAVEDWNQAHRMMYMHSCYHFLLINVTGKHMILVSFKICSQEPAR
jgi:hypothetical protein